ncbi:MAG: VTT domain-containing protein [Acidobacteria bacterium]|nr:VTT domain-containing protein [Acidobacteriota bacterium]
MTGRFRSAIPLVVFAGILLFAGYSWWTGGMVRLMLDSAGSLGDNEAALESLRQVLAQWGPLAPAVYVTAVVVEVLVAPIPGTLLYAPAGALFGGFLGGVLSLTGNTIGAAISCAVGRSLGEQAVARRLEGSRLATHLEAIRARGLWVILLLRLNPLTSSDMVSYTAGALGVPVSRVALGTFIGMAPLCFAQAYLAEQIFRVLPGAIWVLIGAGLLYVAFLVVWFTRKK